MLRHGLNETGRFAAGLIGALLLAAAVSASGAPQGYGSAFAARLLALARLDFGASDLTGAPALQELSAHLAPTLQLLAPGAAIAILAGVPLGLALSWNAAWRLARPMLVLAASVPVFCVALALVWLASRLGWDLAAAKGETFVPALLGGDVAGAFAALAAFGIPALVVGLAGAAVVQAAVRRATRAAAAEPYRANLRLMGLGGWEIDRLYLAPRLLAGLFACLGETALALFAATAVAEWVFGWPGDATLFIHSVALGDWNVAAAILFALAAATIFVGFIGTLAASALGER